MQLSEISEKVNKLANAWENFKSINEQKLQDIKKYKSEDPLFEQQLQKISTDIDQQKDRLSMIENTLSRPYTANPENSTNNMHQDIHQKAFIQYLRYGNDKELSSIEQKALSVASDPDGGYLISHQTSKDIIKSIQEQSYMRNIASIEIISTDSLDIIEDIDSLDAGWVSETDIRKDTTTPKVNKRRIVAHELYAQPKATQKLIDDASINIEQWLAGKLVDIFVIKENESFIHGDGKGKPRGILTYGAGKEWGHIEQIISESYTKMSADSILQLYSILNGAYANKASFLMNRNTIHHIRTLKDTRTNQYIWSPGLGVAMPNSLIGLPVIEAADMPTPKADSLSIALGDFKRAYKIVDRQSIRILRDPFTDKPFVKFYATKRVGGEIVNFHAMKILKFAA